MNPIEILAAIISLTGITLAARGKVVSWPISMVGIALTAWVAYGAKLGGQVVLQAVYMGTSAYGWWNWKKEEKGGEVVFTHLPIRPIVLGLAIAVGASFGLRPVLESFTPVERLNADSAITAFSLLAQFWLTRKHTENWTVWIAVDVWSVMLFWQAEQYVMAGFFAALVGVAVFGLYRHRGK